MSWNNIKKVRVPKGLVRDIVEPLYNESTTQTIDCWNHGYVGLDLLLHNRGAAAIVIALNNITLKSIPPGASYSVEDFKLGLIKVTATDTYDLNVLGVSREKLKSLKLI